MAGRGRGLVLSLLLVSAVGCGSRSVTAGDGGVRLDHPASSDAVWIDHGRRDGALKLDAASFCSGLPRAEIGGVAQAVTEIESGTTMTSCCDGEFMRLKTKGPLGQVTLEVAMLRHLGTPLGLLNIDVAKPPKGWLFSVRCTPYARCGYLHDQNSRLSGSLIINPIPGPPAWGATLCLTVKPLLGIPGLTAVRLWGSAQIKRHCTHGMDQTCNISPLISALYGACKEDGTCVCAPGYVKDSATGKCKTP